MKKIPVGPTIAHAYRFAFGTFPALVKLLWLPMVLTLGLNALVTPQITAWSQAMASHDYSRMSVPGPVIVLLITATWIVAFMLITGIFQVALGRSGTRGRFYFSFAMPLWRLIGATLLLMLVMLALLAIYVIAVLAVLFLFRAGLRVAHVSDTALKDIMALDTGLAFIAGYCAFIFCWIRFGFLLGAATMAEDRIALTRSWTLSHRNFWRMFLVALALFLPLVLLEGASFYALGFFPHVAAGATPAQIRALQQAASAAASARMQHYWYLFYPGGVIVAVFVYAAMAGASVFAYRVLTGDETTPNLP